MNYGAHRRTSHPAARIGGAEPMPRELGFRDGARNATWPISWRDAKVAGHIEQRKVATVLGKRGRRAGRPSLGHGPVSAPRRESPSCRGTAEAGPRHSPPFEYREPSNRSPSTLPTGLCPSSAPSAPGTRKGHRVRGPHLPDRRCHLAMRHVPHAPHRGLPRPEDWPTGVAGAGRP